MFQTIWLLLPGSKVFKYKVNQGFYEFLILGIATMVLGMLGYLEPGACNNIVLVFGPTIKAVLQVI